VPDQIYVREYKNNSKFFSYLLLKTLHGKDLCYKYEVFSIFGKVAVVSMEKF
jgi:hypothetical protein